MARGSGEDVAIVPLGGHEDPLTSYQCLCRAEMGRVLRAEVTRRGIPIHHGARLHHGSRSRPASSPVPDDNEELQRQLDWDTPTG